MRTLISHGHILTVDERDSELADGDILIEDGRIVEVGANLQAEGAKVIDASGMIVAPGFVDTHSHLWEASMRNVGVDWTTPDYMKVMRGLLGSLYEPDDILASTRLGAAEMLNAGVTSVLDCSHNMNTPEHADAAIEGLKSSGIRAILAYGSASRDWDPNSAWKGSLTPVGLSEDARRVRSQYFSGSEPGLISMALCSRGSRAESADEVWFGDIRMARDLDVPITFAAGLKNRERAVPEIQALHEVGLTGPDILCYHGDRYTDDELRILADTGGKVAYTPEVELRSALAVPAIQRMIDFGLKPSLGVDVATGATNTFGQMRTILMSEGARQRFEEPLYRDQTTAVNLTVRDALRMATVNGAYSSWRGGSGGSLEVGKAADIVLIDRESLTWLPVHHVVGSLVFNGTPDHVRGVLVGGEIVKWNGDLVGIDRDAVVKEAYASRLRVLKKAGLDPDTGEIFG